MFFRLRATVLLIFILKVCSVSSQNPITSITTQNSSFQNPASYVIGTNTYNWATTNYNKKTELLSLTSGTSTYGKYNLGASLYLRRNNNSNVSGNKGLYWSEVVNTPTATPTVFNMFATQPVNMEGYMLDNAINKGADNVFVNNVENSNNIERLDYILSNAYTPVDNSKVGIAVFDRWLTTATSDPFKIALITQMNAGMPSGYSSVVSVTATNYSSNGLLANDILFNVLDNVPPSNPNIAMPIGRFQNIKGVFLKFSDFGIAANTPVYGYSIMANDFSGNAANVVDYTNTTYYPTNTAAANGGLDIAASFGIYLYSSSLPVTFGEINAKITKENLNVTWTTLMEKNNNHFIVEYSKNGIDFKELGTLPTKAVGGNADSVLEYTLSKSSYVLNYLGFNPSEPVLFVAITILFASILLTNCNHKYLKKFRQTFFSMAAVILITGITACNKNSADISTLSSNKKVFIRIVQVDEDGTRQLSKTVTAIYND